MPACRYTSSEATLHPPSLSIVVPAFNEEGRLPAHLRSIVTYLEGVGYDFEIVVVDDGSTDGTSAIIESLCSADARIRLVRLPENRGKGYAVKVGVLAAKGMLRLFTDADGSTPIAEMARLEAAVASGAEIAIGSRALPDLSRTVQCKLHRKVMGTIFNRMVRAVALQGICDTQCGFKLFTDKAAEAIFPLQRIDDFGFDVELLYLGRQQGRKIMEVAVNWCDVEGSKVGLVGDSCRMFLDILKVRCFDLLGLYRSAAPWQRDAEVLQRWRQLKD